MLHAADLSQSDKQVSKSWLRCCPELDLPKPFSDSEDTNITITPTARSPDSLPMGQLQFSELPPDFPKE